ncbi:MAG: hypothetical protein L6R43_13300 [Planctomycetes bacterium]|nr:hypothetical protein [Planctomycetota bacterium]
MKPLTAFAAAAVLAAASFALGQETGRDLVGSYDSLAGVILGAKQTEKNLVRAILSGHRAHAAAYAKQGDGAKAAAEMALFANEGDNAVGGVRKRLLEGGHHHNAEGEAKGVYEEGYVVVTRAAKKACLDASMAMQKASDEAGRMAAFEAFEKTAAELLGK